MRKVINKDDILRNTLRKELELQRLIENQRIKSVINKINKRK